MGDAERWPDPSRPEVQLSDGKTKRVMRVRPGVVRIVNKDDIFASDGRKHDIVHGKGWLSAATTVSVFRLLERHGVATYLLGSIPGSPGEFMARELSMLPFEVVARLEATGSALERWESVTDGERLPRPIVEYHDKREYRQAHPDGGERIIRDPLVVFDGPHAHYFTTAGEYLNSYVIADDETLATMAAHTAQIYETTQYIAAILGRAWQALEYRIQDFKLEYGLDVQTGQLLLGDVIDSCSWRLLDPSGRHVDKQNYRDGTVTNDELLRDYALVALMARTFEDPRGWSPRTAA